MCEGSEVHPFCFNTTEGLQWLECHVWAKGEEVGWGSGPWTSSIMKGPRQKSSPSNCHLKLDTMSIFQKYNTSPGGYEEGDHGPLFP